MAARVRWGTLVLAAGLIAFGSVAGSQTSSPVIELLHNARDARTRIQAAVALGRLRPPGARDALQDALSDRVAAVRAAAVEALVSFGDAAIVGVLQAHADDADSGVRAGIARALAQLGVGQNGGAGDWATARLVFRVGTIANRAGVRADVTDVMRNAIVQEVGRRSGLACATQSVLPPEAERRVRSGRLRSFAIDGTVNTLRRWVVATTMSARAEVSLVLTAQPAGTIVGSLSGAATAQDHTPYYDADAFQQRLENRAVVAAVHGALGNLQESLALGP